MIDSKADKEDAYSSRIIKLSAGVISSEDTLSHLERKKQVLEQQPV